MKRIVKNPEPDFFRVWKSSWPDAMIPGWGEFDGRPIKQAVKQALLEEQGYLCCFCENHVEMNHGHIAHLCDQAGHPDRVLDYNNLLYSCPENPRNVPQTCGHAQGNEVLPISPFDTDCETRFAYTGDGSILGKDNDAEYTVQILNLNGSDRLLEGRQVAYEETFDNKMELSPDEFHKWLARVLNRGSDNRFEKPFWTTIKYVADNV